MMERFISSLEAAPIVNVGGYEYFIHPITDGVPRVEPAVLGEVIGAMLRISSLDCDIILAPEAMGIPLGAILSMRAGIPYVVARKRRYGLPDEVEIGRSTGYSKGSMYINDVRKGERVIIIDDVLSTGGTLRPIMLALQRAGAQIAEVLVAVEKGSAGEKLEREFGVPVRALVKVEVRDGRLVVVDRIT